MTILCILFHFDLPSHWVNSTYPTFLQHMQVLGTSTLIAFTIHQGNRVDSFPSSVTSKKWQPIIKHAHRLKLKYSGGCTHAGADPYVGTPLHYKLVSLYECS